MSGLNFLFHLVIIRSTEFFKHLKEIHCSNFFVCIYTYFIPSFLIEFRICGCNIGVISNTHCILHTLRKNCILIHRDAVFRWIIRTRC